ncbi:hypothetical protein jhhlp_007099 [Lomentospora prolificans]|uniref:Protein phosphatase n=1 Tax=Lomentospora prolificans TaxID=41688 RepID=A0A2N3N1R6_9PEZI|nr:hypothetical protein jhhlp_007099 [Lomentospora prolificans]
MPNLAQVSVSGCTRFLSSQPAARYNYGIAASFIAKGHKFDPATHVYQFNPNHRVQRAKKSKESRPDSGHDAFFASRLGDTGAVAFGVTDGVGGWVESNVDPADFSHAFCDYMAAQAYYHGTEADQPKEHLTARRLMEKGYSDVLHDRSITAGGSTACVAIASPDGCLDVANLGDSGYIILRLNGVHAYSQPQTHDFNTPYQLSAIPPIMLSRMAMFGGRGFSDMPRDADVTHKCLQHGDVVVFATDGVWDNLFNQDILHVASAIMTSTGAWQMTDGGSIRVSTELAKYVKAPEGPAEEAGALPLRTLQSTLATSITAAAKRASLDRKLDSPFAKEVRTTYPNERWDGGKVDDICVVVAIVCEDTGPKPRL